MTRTRKAVCLILAAMLAGSGAALLLASHIGDIHGRVGRMPWFLVVIGSVWLVAEALDR
jgi:hypothetical protein